MRYERPVLRELLGDEALGANCNPGSTASPDCGGGTNVDPSCVDGDYANSGNCGAGYQAGGCGTGNDASANCSMGAYYWGTCTNGDYAGSPCSTGWDPAGAACIDGSTT